MRALWIEITLTMKTELYVKSRPVRALWIEINLVQMLSEIEVVEAREGLVD